jgi:hypothetical protein
VRIPTLEQPDVNEQAMPTPFGSSSFAPVAAQLEQTTGVLQKAKDHIDSIRTQDALNTLDERMKKEAWDPNPTPADASEDPSWGGTKAPTGGPHGFMLRLGKDAVDPSAHLQRLSDMRDDIAKTLADNPVAAEQFRMHSAGRLAMAGQQAQEHSGQQIRVVMQQTANASWQAALDKAGLFHPTPTAADPTGTDAIARDTRTAFEMAVPSIVNQLRANGETDRVIQQTLAKKKEELTAKALSTLIDDWNGTGARALYNKVEKDLGALAPQTNKLVIRAERRQKAGLDGGEAALAARDENTGWVDMTKGLAAIEAKHGPSEALTPEGESAKSQEMAQFKQRALLYNEAAQEKETDTLAQLKAVARKAPGGIQLPDTYTGPGSDKPLFDTLRPKAQEELRTWVDEQQRKSERDSRADDAESRRIRMEARRDAAEMKKERDGAAKDRWSELTPEQQRDADVEKDFHDASDELRAHMHTQQKTVSTQLKKGDGPSLSDFKDEVKRTVDGFIPPKGPDSRARNKAVQDYMVDWYHKQYEANKNTPPPTAEAQKELSKLRLGETPGAYWGTNPITEIEAEMQGKKFLPPTGEQPKPKYVPNPTPAPKAATPEAGAGGLTVPEPAKVQTPPGPGWKPRKTKDGTPIWFNPADGKWKPRG